MTLTFKHLKFGGKHPWATHQLKIIETYVKYVKLWKPFHNRENTLHKENTIHCPNTACMSADQYLDTQYRVTFLHQKQTLILHFLHVCTSTHNIESDTSISNTNTDPLNTAATLKQLKIQMGIFHLRELLICLGLFTIYLFQFLEEPINTMESEI